MQTFVTLFNFTEKAIGNIDDVPDGIAAAVQQLEQLGGKNLCTYITMGAYDVVTVWQAPDEKVAMTMLLILGRYGNVRSQTLKAFSLDEFGALVEGLPEEEE